MNFLEFYLTFFVFLYFSWIFFDFLWFSSFFFDFQGCLSSRVACVALEKYRFCTRAASRRSRDNFTIHECPRCGPGHTHWQRGLNGVALATRVFDGVASATYWKAVCQMVWLAQHFEQIWRGPSDKFHIIRRRMATSASLGELATSRPAVPALPSRAHLQD